MKISLVCALALCLALPVAAQRFKDSEKCKLPTIGLGYKADARCLNLEVPMDYREETGETSRR